MSELWAKWEGQIIEGGYPLRRLVGVSDHSGVFLTEAPAFNLSHAALKLVPAIPTLADAQLAHWNAAASLSHPRLLRLFAAGRCQLGSLHFLYVLMEYADQNLAHLLENRALTEIEARETLPPTLDGLAFLHAQNLVHGQLKPSNILVVGEQLKLASDTIRPADEAAATVSMQSVYDPPESRDGSFSTAGDVWALGVTLYEALTRTLPARPDDRSHGVVLPADFPPASADVIKECLSRRPTDRPTVAALQAWIGGKVRYPGEPSSTNGDVARGATAGGGAGRAGGVGDGYGAVGAPVGAGGAGAVGGGVGGGSGSGVDAGGVAADRAAASSGAPAGGSVGGAASGVSAGAFGVAGGSGGVAVQRAEGAAAGGRASYDVGGDALAGLSGAAADRAAALGGASASGSVGGAASGVAAGAFGVAGGSGGVAVQRAEGAAAGGRASYDVGGGALAGLSGAAADRASAGGGALAGLSGTAADRAAASSGALASGGFGDFGVAEATRERAATAAATPSQTPPPKPASDSGRLTIRAVVERETVPEEPVPTGPGFLPWVVVAIVAIALGWVVMHFLNSHSSATQNSPAAEAAAAPTASVPPDAASAPVPTPATPPAPPVAAPRSVESNTAQSPDVVHEEQPRVSQRSLSTIHGHLKVVVRVTVDPSGAVVEDNLSHPGPSHYFSRVASETALKWKFVPTEQKAPREWWVHFDFSKSGVTTRVTSGKP